MRCPFLQAGEGEDGRLKSAIGIGSLLMDGLGDTIRVSLTEDPEYELDPCRYSHNASVPANFMFVDAGLNGLLLCYDM